MNHRPSGPLRFARAPLVLALVLSAAAARAEIPPGYYPETPEQDPR
jgi:hypothetical protein